ncbi:hypothetical protein [Streptomyces blattellae]|uniref:hypothetical protein n=1 Tax=Streptomyces blattellae TaxID=2569855 RepID=UPI0012B931EB|nr:hypothetical protein [Streptomyces blattellae]
MGGRLVSDVLTQLLVPTALGMIVGECTEVSPWLARRILRGAARMLGNSEATDRYEAEWLALLEERPGKLLKLFFAIWIALRGTWTLRAINRPTVSTSASPSGRADDSRAETPSESQVPGSRHAQAGNQPADHHRGVTVSGHYRSPGLLGRSSQRRRPWPWMLLGIVVLASWLTHLSKTAEGPADFVTTSIALSCLGLLGWIYCAMTVKRVRARLATGSLPRDGWALRIMRVPDGSARRIRRAIADGQDVRIVIPGRSANIRHVVDVPPLSGLAIVLRPPHRRRPRR